VFSQTRKPLSIKQADPNHTRSKPHKTVGTGLLEVAYDYMIEYIADWQNMGRTYIEANSSHHDLK
jgi:hypothetical protein